MAMPIASTAAETTASTAHVRLLLRNRRDLRPGVLVLSPGISDMLILPSLGECPYTWGMSLATGAPRDRRCRLTTRCWSRGRRREVCVAGWRQDCSEVGNTADE